MLILLVAIQLYWLCHLYIKTVRLERDKTHLYITVHNANTLMETIKNNRMNDIKTAQEERENEIILLQTEHQSLYSDYTALLNEVELTEERHHSTVTQLTQELHTLEHNYTLLIKDLTNELHYKEVTYERELSEYITTLQSLNVNYTAIIHTKNNLTIQLDNEINHLLETLRDRDDLINKISVHLKECQGREGNKGKKSDKKRKKRNSRWSNK